MSSIAMWGADPWGREVPLHVSWWLAGLALAAGAAFLLAHLLWMRRGSGAAKASSSSSSTAAAAVPPALASCVPATVQRHSLAARLFHWVMAACMLTLLATAFLPKVGLSFAWVQAHWTAGVVLILALLFHVIQSTLFADFKSIWPDRRDLSQLTGSSGSGAKPGKYPLGNKLFHLASVGCGFVVVLSGAIMLSKVRTPFFPRNPYLLSDGTWGAIYVLHGLAGAALITLTVIHIYFALRPEKRPITVSMLTGSMERDYVLAHHDPALWPCGPEDREAAIGRAGQGGAA